MRPTSHIRPTLGILCQVANTSFATPKPNDNGRTSLPAALKDEAAEQGRGHFAAWFAQFEALARPKTLAGAKNTCVAGRFGRSSRQSLRHLGNIGLYSAV